MEKRPAPVAGAALHLFGSVELEDLLRDAVAPQGHGAAAFAGQVAGPRNREQAALVDAAVVQLEELPELLFLLQGFGGAVHGQENAGDRHHHGQIVEHIGAQLFLFRRQAVEVDRRDHQLGHA